MSESKPQGPSGAPGPQGEGPPLGELVRRARTAQGDELGPLLHHRNEEVLLALVENPNLRELQKIRFLRRRDLPVRLFGKIAAERSWTDQYAVRLALAKNPKTPRHLFQRILPRFLILDLVKVASDPYVSADRKLYINRLIAERAPRLPLGTKITLSKKAGPDVIEALLRENPPVTLVRQVIESRFLSERMVIRAIGAHIRSEAALAAIAIHPEWGRRYPVRVALAKNAALGHGHRARILQELRVFDLREVLADCSGHTHIVRAVQAELETRPEDGRARGRTPLTREEIERALSEAKRKKRERRARKKSASALRGVSPRAPDASLAETLRPAAAEEVRRNGGNGSGPGRDEPGEGPK